MNLYWRDDAACRLESAALFDPISTSETRANATARIHRAQTVCRRCPVEAECIAEAVREHDSGIRGGVLFDVGTPCEIRFRGRAAA